MSVRRFSRKLSLSENLALRELSLILLIIILHVSLRGVVIGKGGLASLILPHHAENIRTADRGDADALSLFV